MSLIAAISVAERGVSARLSVLTGKGLALVGANGSGKTTLIEAIAGLIDVTDARITLDGRTVATTGARSAGFHLALRDRHIALLSQDSMLFPHLTARDNVAFPLRARGTRRAAARARALQLLAEVGAEDCAHATPAQLSGGQARRVALARALASEPRLVLIDEPFAGIDAASVGPLREAVERTTAHVTRIIATHDAHDALRLADHIAVMDSGKVAAYGAAHELLSRPPHRTLAAMTGKLWLSGTWVGTGLQTGAGIVPCGGPGLERGADAAVAIDPSLITLADDPTTAPLRDEVVSLDPQPGGKLRVTGRQVCVDLSYDDPRGATLQAGLPFAARLHRGVTASVAVVVPRIDVASGGVGDLHEREVPPSDKVP